MSKTLLLNDTRKYHHGCAKVIETFKFDHSIETNSPVDVNFAEYTDVILNGEGTMHHTRVDNRQNPIKFLKALSDAQAAGCNTQIVNSVWQDMTNDFDQVLQKCSVVEVRDIVSQQELKDKHNINSVVKPDRSLIPDVPYEEYDHVMAYQGRWFLNENDVSPPLPRIDIFEMPWNEIVNRLRHCDLLITGRHHEAYAAIKARCKFIVRPGNTHKNQGIYLNAGIKPFTEIGFAGDIINGKYNKEFEKLSEYYVGTDERNN